MAQHGGSGAICENPETESRSCNQDECCKYLKMYQLETSAQQVGFFNIGLCRVLDKISGSWSGSGRVGVSKYTIGYFRVSLLFSGISGYFGYFRVCRVFSGISGFSHIY